MIPRAIRALQPDALLQDPWTLQERAVVVVKGHSIRAIVSAEDVPANLTIEPFPGELWAAAPVMAHAHLESFDAPSADWARDDFAAWVEALLAWREQPGRLTSEESAAFSLAELQRFGCGMVLSHVAEVGAEGHGALAMPEVMAAMEIFAPDAEMFNPSLQKAVADASAVALHAPYSVAPQVARQVFAAKREEGLVSIHLGEFADERALLAEGKGCMAELLQQRGRGLPSGRWASPVAWLKEMGGARPGSLAVHGGDLTAAELQELHRAGVGMVFCPGTHAYFKRPKTAYVEAGIPLPALGCDSRASNTRLDPLREVALAWQQMPEPGPQAWWDALTRRGAALTQRRELGSLAVGYRSRFLRITDPTLLATPNAQAACARLCSGDALAVIVSDFGLERAS